MESENVAHATTAPPTEKSYMQAFYDELFGSPINIILVITIAVLIYKIIGDRLRERRESKEQKPAEPELPKLRRDFTLAELKQYDGTQPDGRVLMGVNGNVYDVTKGKRFYGPGGPYATFAGRDASRNLATFSIAPIEKEGDDLDDLSDLSAMEMDSVREWEMQFKEQYPLVGKLLRKGEQPTNYEDEEDDPTTDNNKTDTSVADPTEPAPETDTPTAPQAVAEGLRKRIAEGNKENAATSASSSAVEDVK